MTIVPQNNFVSLSTRERQCERISEVVLDTMTSRIAKGNMERGVRPCLILRLSNKTKKAREKKKGEATRATVAAVRQVAQCTTGACS